MHQNIDETTPLLPNDETKNESSTNYRKMWNKSLRITNEICTDCGCCLCCESLRNPLYWIVVLFVLLGLTLHHCLCHTDVSTCVRSDDESLAVRQLRRLYIYPADGFYSIMIIYTLCQLLFLGDSVSKIRHNEKVLRSSLTILIMYMTIIALNTILMLFLRKRNFFAARLCIVWMGTMTIALLTLLIIDVSIINYYWFVIFNRIFGCLFWLAAMYQYIRVWNRLIEYEIEPYDGNNAHRNRVCIHQYDCPFIAAIVLASWSFIFLLALFDEKGLWSAANNVY